MRSTEMSGFNVKPNCMAGPFSWLDNYVPLKCGSLA
jgi:hypothetical protein